MANLTDKVIALGRDAIRKIAWSEFDEQGSKDRDTAFARAVIEAALPELLRSRDRYADGMRGGAHALLADMVARTSYKHEQVHKFAHELAVAIRAELASLPEGEQTRKEGGAVSALLDLVAEEYGGLPGTMCADEPDDEPVWLGRDKDDKPIKAKITFGHIRRAHAQIASRGPNSAGLRAACIALCKRDHPTIDPYRIDNVLDSSTWHPGQQLWENYRETVEIVLGAAGQSSPEISKEEVDLPSKIANDVCNDEFAHKITRDLDEWSWLHGVIQEKASAVLEAFAAHRTKGPFEGHCCTPKEGEPFFVLLGRDVQAGALVEQWAADRAKANPNDDKIAGAKNIAARMFAYAKSIGKDPARRPDSLRQARIEAREEERQACAAIADEHAHPSTSTTMPNGNDHSEGARLTASSIAALIRNRALNEKDVAP